MVIYIILKRRLYRNSCTNCYIINVAIADLCFTLICVPVTMTAYIFEQWIFGEFACHFENLLMFVSNIFFMLKNYVTVLRSSDSYNFSIRLYLILYFFKSSIQAACLTLTAMTVDRYAAILYPFKSLDFRTTKIAFFINVIIWIASFTLNIPYYLYYQQVKMPNHLDYDGNETNQTANSTIVDSHDVYYCASQFPSKNMEIALTIYTVIISYCLPLLTIIFCYMRMMIKLLAKSKDQKLLEKSKNFSNKGSVVLSSTYGDYNKTSFKKHIKVGDNKNFIYSYFGFLIFKFIERHARHESFKNK